MGNPTHQDVAKNHGRRRAALDCVCNFGTVQANLGVQVFSRHSSSKINLLHANSLCNILHQYYMVEENDVLWGMMVVLTAKRNQ